MAAGGGREEGTALREAAEELELDGISLSPRAHHTAWDACLLIT
ncbi:hypothetical protein ACQEU5_03475 [Marinactinospora thermotolerans]